MTPIRLAFSFIRIPRLFVSLLLWPLIIGLGIAVLQAITSSAYFGLVTETSKQYEDRVRLDSPEHKWIKRSLFGTSKLPPLTVCRWQQKGSSELPPAGCAIKPYDVVIRTSNPQHYQSAEYESFFQGSTRTVHICKSCRSDIIIQADGSEVVADVFGLSAIGVYMLADLENDARISTHYISAKRSVEHLKDISGTMYLHPEGSKNTVNMTQATKTMILIINTSLITIIALWLSLKGHRKVLDYFARNGALLPLVATCGKNQFYAALWIITLFRVAFFLLAALPTTALLYSVAVPDETLEVFMKSWPEFLLWVAGIITSLGCLAIVASIAELKHRHSWVSFLYRYVPLSLCSLGTAAWFFCMFHSGSNYRIAQSIIAAVPVIGISPVLLSPLFALDNEIIAFHSMTAAVLVVLMLRANSRWFAAHLEEI